MKRIDQQTVQKILDAADIVEVVSDFVNLKRRGANYIGLCPFHNERTPSFSVSKSKGICKCFSCGKGGSPVHFLMELEQLSFNEALRYLAKKYNIEIQEHEMSVQERQQQTERESMLAINDFAMRHFEKTMATTPDGIDIGRAYFSERGINEAMQQRFHLGYALDKRDDLYTTAINKGYNEKYLFDTGLCYKTERGTVRDRFSSRVIFPVFTVSGKVVAFGGRTLRKDKDVAKYVNSPESIIYKKSNELYGLYQAKQAIVRKDKCILVEGYMDVISMHQSGVENVVASSGTSLTEGQIRLIHRFTENVTVIYDSDPAGIKASMRGIDLLLAEGLNIKVMLLPEGDDPDSFAQTHTSTQVEEYLNAHEEDFITFKTRILLGDISNNDPIAKSRAVQNIVRSISMIPDAITRNIYIAQCSRSMQIPEKVLTLEVSKLMADKAERDAAEQLRQRNRRQAGLPPEPSDQPSDEPTQQSHTATAATSAPLDPKAQYLEPFEREILRYAIKFGMATMCEYQGENDQMLTMNVLDYINQELAADDITFTNPNYALTMQQAVDIATHASESEINARRQILEDQRQQTIAEGIDRIRSQADDIDSIERSEKDLRSKADSQYTLQLEDYLASYIASHLLSHHDDTVRNIATTLSVSKHHLSKIHTKFAKIPREIDRLVELVPIAIYNLKCAIVEYDLRSLKQQINDTYKAHPDQPDLITPMLRRSAELNEIKKELAKYLGERILSPRLK